MLVAFCDQSARELDAALLERRVVRVADHRVAQLPLDLVERMDAGGRVTTFAGQSPWPQIVVLAATFRHPLLPLDLTLRDLSARFSGGTMHSRELPRTEPAPDDSAKSGFGAGIVPRELQIRDPVELARGPRGRARRPLGGQLAAGRRDRELDPVDERLDVGGVDRPLVGRLAGAPPAAWRGRTAGARRRACGRRSAPCAALLGGEPRGRSRALSSAADRRARRRRDDSRPRGWRNGNGGSP